MSLRLYLNTFVNNCFIFVKNDILQKFCDSISVKYGIVKYKTMKKVRELCHVFVGFYNFRKI